ncbi:MAG: hypothetical protein ACYCVM_08660, partial [Acidiferrobacter sp.]
SASRRGADLAFALRGNAPLSFRLGNTVGCRVTDGPQPLVGRRHGPLIDYHLEAHHGHFAVVCP